jgi:pyruvate formate lyase activating enzyme
LKFQIGGLQKLSLLDFPKRMCAIVFTTGCNYRCPYCHNFELVENGEGDFSTEEVLDYLVKRKNVLDGVTITGGEPTLQPGLEDFMKEVKQRTNLQIKLDTNGTNPQIVEKLLKENLVDYVAMDIKNDFDNYSEVIGIKNYDTAKIKETIKIIKENAKEFEFRTTIIKDYHKKENIKKILDYIGKDSNYYLQQFIVSENVPNKKLTSYTDEELKQIVKELSEEYPKVNLRGIKN